MDIKALLLKAIPTQLRTCRGQAIAYKEPAAPSSGICDMGMYSPGYQKRNINTNPVIISIVYNLPCLQIMLGQNE